VTGGVNAGNVSGNNGLASFSPETSGDGDGTSDVAGAAADCDRSGGNRACKAGLPFAAVRGGNWSFGPTAGVFALNLNDGPSRAYTDYGARCCRRR
jgi:hypothetical protein